MIVVLFIGIGQISYKTISSRHPPTYPRTPSMSLRPTTRSGLPVFAAPFHFPRERFQVNSIGRPILRTQNYHHPFGYNSQVRQ